MNSRNRQQVCLAILLGVLSLWGGCSSPSAPTEEAPVPLAKPGSILFSNNNASSFSFLVFDAAGGSVPLVSTPVLEPFKSIELGVPTGRNLVIHAKSESKEYHLVKGNADAVFSVNPTRPYHLVVTYDFFGNSNNLVWDWSIRADPAVLVQKIKVVSGPGLLKVTWKDPSMPDLQAIRVWPDESGSTVSVALGVEMATFEGLTPGQTYTFNFQLVYPESTVVKLAMASGVPDVIPATPTITFNANGGTGAMTAQPLVPGASAALQASTFTRLGYSFAGWATTAAGTSAYADRASYTMGAASVTLYATWAANQTITFQANGGAREMEAQTLATGASANLKTNLFIRTGYSFAGWATTSAGSVAYTDGASYTMGATGVNLYAIWAASQNTITFHANGGAGTMTPQMMATGTSANLMTNTFTRQGYSFAGWAGGGRSYSDGEMFSMGTSDTSLYAQWTALPWTNYTTANGLGSNYVLDVEVSGSSLYAGTAGGLSVSTDGGTSWTNYTTSHGLGANWVSQVVISGSSIYAATNGGLSVSTNGGISWINYTTADGLGLDQVYGVAVSGANIYAATHGGGLSVSTNGGLTWTTYTTAHGLANNSVSGVAVSDGNIYAATYGGGLSVSTNGGATWTIYTTAHGLVANELFDVTVAGSYIYVSTGSGLSVSHNGGTTWTTHSTNNGMGGWVVTGVAVSGSNLYAATSGGLSILTSGLATWSNYPKSSGLGSNSVSGVAVSGTKIYAATAGGVSVSP